MRFCRGCGTNFSQTLPAGKKHFGISFCGVTRRSGDTIASKILGELTSVELQEKTVILEWHCAKQGLLQKILGNQF